MSGLGIGLQLALAALIGLGLLLYLLFGGADFGGGVWDLLASGPRKQAQREVIEDAIGPVWEVNHVWLIFVVVLLFSGFPRAFAAISVALHVPLTAFLLGVVFRGSAFTFRAYDSRADAVQRRWGRLFSWASVLSPVLLGMSVGALASGAIRVSGRTVSGGFFAPWLQPFSIATGLLALAMVSLLAATYLVFETVDAELRNDFRRRALGAAGALVITSAAALGLAFRGAPELYAGLTGHRWAWPLFGGTAVAAAATFWALLERRYRWIRPLAAIWVCGIALGWMAAQYPYWVVPDVTVENAAARPATLELLLVSAGVGSVLLVPSLVALLRIFKSGRWGSHG